MRLNTKVSGPVMRALRALEGLKVQKRAKDHSHERNSEKETV